LDAQEVLIRIRTEFKDQATQMARQAFSNLRTQAKSLGEDLRLGLAGGDIGKQAPLLSRLGAGISGIAGGAQKLRGTGDFLQNFAGNLNAASMRMRGFVGGMRNTIKTLTLFNSIFGRVTTAMLIWSGWRKVADGFRAIADSIVGANMRMQSAQQMFTALSGGSEEVGGRYIEIIRSLAIETGTSVDKLVSNAKRLPTQVGQNFEAFTNLTKKAIVLGFLDPAQDVEGAMFAISNFMEGTAAGARSLVQRFELFNSQMVQRAFEQAADPVEALDILFKEANIDVDLMIEKLEDTMPVALNGLNAMFREFFRILGQPAMTNITEEVVRLRDWVRDNQPQLQGLGQSFGQGVERGFQRAKDFIFDIIGLDEFDAESWFDAGVELMVNLTDGMFNALSSYVLPAIATIANVIGGFFIGASPPPMGPLSQIMEGGKNTIEAYVEGLVAGLNSEAISGMAQDILNNIINLEAQELAQEKAIDQLEAWVEEASNAVDAKRREIKLFDLQTEDIPERFTRGRKRQLELELLAAQDEEKRRKKALDLAKKQLEITRRYLRAQEQILRTLEQQQKEREKEEKEEAGKGLDKGLKDVTGFDSAAMEAEIAKWKAIFDQKLQPLFDSWKEGLGDLADFVRGFLGVGMGEDVSEKWLMGANTREGIDNIIEGLGKLGESVQDVLDGAGDTWEGMDPNLKNLILAAVGVLVFPKVALVAGVTLLLDDPTNVKGLLLLIGGLFGTGAGGAVIGGAGKVLPITFKVIFSGAVGILSLILKAAGISVAGIGAGAGIGASALVLPVTVMVGLIAWRGKDLLKTTLEIDGLLVITALKGLDWVKEQFAKAGVEIFPETDFEQGAEDAAEYFGTAVTNVEEKLKQPWEYLWNTAMPKVVEDATPDIETAAENILYGIPVSQAERGHEALVGMSIIPDTMDAIVRLWRDLPGRITPHLETLHSTIIRMMKMISFEWEQEWMDMMINTGNAMSYMANQFMELEAMLQEMSYMNQQLEYQQAQAATSQTQGVGSDGGVGSVSVDLSLDQDETRRFWEEGTYGAISGVFE